MPPLEHDISQLRVGIWTAQTPGSKGIANRGVSVGVGSAKVAFRTRARECDRVVLASGSDGEVQMIEQQERVACAHAERRRQADATFTIASALVSTAQWFSALKLIGPIMPG